MVLISCRAIIETASRLAASIILCFCNSGKKYSTPLHRVFCLACFLAYCGLTSTKYIPLHLAASQSVKNKSLIALDPSSFVRHPPNFNVLINYAPQVNLLWESSLTDNSHSSRRSSNRYSTHRHGSLQIEIVTLPIQIFHPHGQHERCVAG